MYLDFPLDMSPGHLYSPHHLPHGMFSVILNKVMEELLRFPQSGEDFKIIFSKVQKQKRSAHYFSEVMAFPPFPLRSNLSSKLTLVTLAGEIACLSRCFLGDEISRINNKHK